MDAHRIEPAEVVSASKKLGRGDAAALVKQAARVFEDLGAKVEEADPGFEDQQDVFTLHWFPGAAYVVRGIPPAKRKLMDKGLLQVARAGEKITLQQYQDAVAKRGALGVLMNRFHEKYDLLITPTLPLGSSANSSGRASAYSI